VQNFNSIEFLSRYTGVIWLVGFAAVLLPLLIGTWQVRRLTRRCVTLDGPEWNSLLKETAASLNLQRRVRLLSSPGVILPMTWGAWRPVVLLPAAANEWRALRRRVVLRHELAHVQRWDWLTCTLAYVACAFYWYNPLAWYAARRMRLEREQACDDLVLRRDTLPSDYAGELLQLAAGFTSHRLIDWATVPMARRSALEGRLLAILDERRNRAGLTRAGVSGVLMLAAAVTVPVAMLRAAATTNDATNPSTPTATQKPSDGSVASSAIPAATNPATNPFASSSASAKAPTMVKLTSLDLRPWGPTRGMITHAWGNQGRHNPTLKLGGEEFADGITMTAGGALYLNLAGGTDKFTATIGMDGAGPGTNPPIKAVFKVIGDGKVLYESTPLQRGAPPGKIDIDVDTHGVQTLALDVRIVGDVHYGDMRDADWADATFAVSGAQPQPVASLAETALPAGTPERLGLVQAFIVQGNVTMIDENGNASPLVRGAPAATAEGKMFEAGPNSQALLVFSNGATVKLLNNSTVKVTLFRQAPFDEQAEGTFLRLSHDPSRSNTVLDVSSRFRDISSAAHDFSSDIFQGEVKQLNTAAGSTFIVNGPHGPINVTTNAVPTAAAPVDTAAQNAMNTAIVAPVKLSSLDLNAWGPSTRRNHNIKIGNQEFIDGVSVRVMGGEVYLKLDGGSELFTASVGLDNPYPDNGPSANQAVVFRVYGGSKVLYESSPIRQGDAPVKIGVDVRGVKTLALSESPVGNFTGGNRFGDWADATLVVSGAKPQTEVAPVDFSIPDSRSGMEVYMHLPPGPDNPHVALVIPNPPGVAGAMEYIDIIPGKSLMLTDAVTQVSKLIKQPTGLANITRKLSDGSIKKFTDVNWQAAMEGKVPDFPLEDGDMVIIF